MEVEGLDEFRLSRVTKEAFMVAGKYQYINVSAQQPLEQKYPLCWHRGNPHVAPLSLRTVPDRVRVRHIASVRSMQKYYMRLD
jgi:hypothetical protein